MKIKTLIFPALLASVLAACATPPRNSADAAYNVNSARTQSSAPAPDWSSLRAKLAGALRNVASIEIGEAGADGLRLQIPVADGFASGSVECVRRSRTRSMRSPPPSRRARRGGAGHRPYRQPGQRMYNLQLSIARSRRWPVPAIAALLARLSVDGRGEADLLTITPPKRGVRAIAVEIICDVP